MFQRYLSSLILFALLLHLATPPVYAQTGCSLQINEVMYHPTGDVSAEWVELFVSQNIIADTTFFITDLEGGVGNFFNKVFTIPAGTMQGSYIIINNDGDMANDGQTTMTGIYTTISYFIGNGSAELANTGDEVALYEGGDTDGTPCDYVEYEGGNSGMPAGFSWDGSCTVSNSDSPGVGISLDPDGAASNSSCDWATSGENSPNHPNLTITGAPHTKGWSNNATPTAVSLSAFNVTSSPNWFSFMSNGIAITFVGLAVLKRWRKPRL